MKFDKPGQLEHQVYEAVRLTLTEGEPSYVCSLSRAALLEALENELRFLGLYAWGDTEAPRVIHTLLEKHLDDWRKDAGYTTPYATPGHEERVP